MLPGHRGGQGAGRHGNLAGISPICLRWFKAFDWQGKGKYRLLLGTLGPVSLKCFGVPRLFPSIAKADPETRCVVQALELLGLPT